jgi:hypothetical protein
MPWAGHSWVPPSLALKDTDRAEHGNTGAGIQVDMQTGIAYAVDSRFANDPPLPGGRKRDQTSYNAHYPPKKSAYKKATRLGFYQPSKDNRDWKSVKSDYPKLAHVPVQQMKPTDTRIDSAPFEGTTEARDAFPAHPVSYKRATAPRTIREPSPPFEAQSSYQANYPNRAHVPRAPLSQPPDKRWQSDRKGEYTTEAQSAFPLKKGRPAEQIKPVGTYQPTKDNRDWKSAKSDYPAHKIVLIKPVKPIHKRPVHVPFEGMSESQRSFVPKKGRYVRAKGPQSIREPGQPFDCQTMNQTSLKKHAFVPRAPSSRPPEQSWIPQPFTARTEAQNAFVPKKANVHRVKRVNAYEPTKDNRDWKTEDSDTLVKHACVPVKPVNPIMPRLKPRPFEGTTESQRAFVPKKAEYKRNRGPKAPARVYTPFEGTTEHDDRIGPIHDSRVRCRGHKLSYRPVDIDGDGIHHLFYFHTYRTNTLKTKNASGIDEALHCSLQSPLAAISTCTRRVNHRPPPR